MFNVDAMWEMNSAHHKELLQVAEAQRSLVKARELSQQPRVRILHYIGDALIFVGSRLKARYTHVAHETA